MARWRSTIRTHARAMRALDAILDDITIHPGNEHPDLKYLAGLIETKPDKKDPQPALDLNFNMDQLESTEA